MDSGLSQRPSRLTALARLAFWAATVFAFVMATLPHPLALPASPSDKVQHIIAFTVITALCVVAYAGEAWWKILLRLSAFGALIEVVQAIPMLHRDSDVRDWLADTAAIGVVLIVYGVWRSRAARS